VLTVIVAQKKPQTVLAAGGCCCEWNVGPHFGPLPNRSFALLLMLQPRAPFARWQSNQTKTGERPAPKKQTLLDTEKQSPTTGPADIIKLEQW